MNADPSDGVKEEGALSGSSVPRSMKLRTFSTKSYIVLFLILSIMALNMQRFYVVTYTSFSYLNGETTTASFLKGEKTEQNERSPALKLDTNDHCNASFLQQSDAFKCLTLSEDGKNGSFSVQTEKEVQTLRKRGEVIDLFPPSIIRQDLSWWGRRFNNLLSIVHAASTARACGKLLILPQKLDNRGIHIDGNATDTPFSYFNCVDFRQSKIPWQMKEKKARKYCSIRKNFSQPPADKLSRAISRYWLSKVPPQNSDFLIPIYAEAKRVTAAYWGLAHGSYRCKECSSQDLDRTVAYVRSGDIFGVSNFRSYPHKGQPPLDYYVKAIRQTGAAKVTVIAEDWLNPVTKALELYNWSEDGGSPVELDVQVSGDYEEVLQQIFCAKALFMAQTSMLLMAAYSANLKSLYLGKVDGLSYETNKVDDWRFQGERHSSKLMSLMTNTEVYGYIATADYSVFDYWNKTPDQMTEMLTYDDGKLVKLM